MTYSCYHQHILEGHTGKVLGAKFIADETHKVVSDLWGVDGCLVISEVWTGA